MTRLDKHWSVIRRAFAILIKNQPVTFRRNDREYNIPINCDLSAIREGSLCCYSTRACDIAQPVDHFPTFKVVSVVCGESLVNGIISFGFPAGDLNIRYADSYNCRLQIVKIDRCSISYFVLLENCSIIRNRGICCQIIRSRYRSTANLIDGE